MKVNGVILSAILVARDKLQMDCSAYLKYFIDSSDIILLPNSKIFLSSEKLTVKAYSKSLQ